MTQEARFKQAFDELQARHAAGEELEILALDAANAAVAALTLASPGALYTLPTSAVAHRVKSCLHAIRVRESSQDHWPVMLLMPWLL